MYQVILSVLSCAVFSQDLDILLSMWFQFSFNFIKSKSNFSLYSLFYAEACNEFAGTISASLRPSNTAPFEEISQQWLAVGNAYHVYMPSIQKLNEFIFFFRQFTLHFSLFLSIIKKQRIKSI